MKHYAYVSSADNSSKYTHQSTGTVYVLGKSKSWTLCSRKTFKDVKTFSFVARVKKTNASRTCERR